MKFGLLLTAAVLLLSGCSPIYYAPNTLNVPMIRAKGEGTVSGHAVDRGLNFQGAYGLKDNWAVMADGFFAGEGSGTSKGSGYLLSGGFGHYRPIGTRFVWDTYGILGYGHVENHFAGRDVSSSLVRYGVQPSFGFQSKFFDTAIGARLVGLRYFSANGDPIEVQYLKDAGTQYLFEPALTVRVGYDVVKVQAQFGHSYNLTNRNFRQDRDIASLGIVYTFGRN